MKKSLLILALTYQGSVMALPFAELKVFHHAHKDGSHSYYIAKLKNTGPIAENIATTSDHGVFDWNSNTFYPAGGISLNDDENIFQFGVDTLRDDIEITNIGNGKVTRAGHFTKHPSPFYGITMDGFDDSDGDGIANKIAIWNLSEETEIGDALKVGDSVHWVRFTTNAPLEHFNIWVQGSDDGEVWGPPGELTLHGAHGHFNATRGHYMSVILERGVTPKTLPRKYKRHILKTK